ncbi:MAG: hypothetical protein D6765_01860, partial [Bacteroidetes bacterium]
MLSSWLQRYGKALRCADWPLPLRVGLLLGGYLLVDRLLFGMTHLPPEAYESAFLVGAFLKHTSGVYRAVLVGVAG